LFVGGAQRRAGFGYVIAIYVSWRHLLGMEQLSAFNWKLERALGCDGFRLSEQLSHQSDSSTKEKET
jgi:hypothetical protein